MPAPEQPSEPARNLTVDEVRAELAHIKPGAPSPLRDAIAGHSARSGHEVAEKLNEAVKRALSTRTIPAGVPFDAALAEIARSIASGVNRSRSRAREHISDLPSTNCSISSLLVVMRSQAPKSSSSRSASARSVPMRSIGFPPTMRSLRLSSTPFIRANVETISP